MKYKDILFNWVVDLEEKSQVEEVNSSIHVKYSAVNLPKLEVPHFYGNCENWISFKELFKSSILDNKSIRDLEKLQYLQASVRGDAAKLIRGFAIAVDNLMNCSDILCNRFFPIAFSADIAKMYRQILISQDDACFQQIFWRKSPEEPLVIFKLNTVTGTSCAPFLAIRTLKQLCEDEKHRFPQAAKLAKDHFYVDDLLAGADSLDSASKIVHELLNLMSAGGFELRKWSCTHPKVLLDLPNTLKTNISSHSFDDEPTQKILGLFWDLNEDSFKVRAVLSDQVSTKRQMLSIIARIFDPLGFVSPSTIILKIILQDLWKAGLDWDDEISSDIFNRWNRFQAEISYLKQIKVPRVNFHAGQELVVSLICQQFWIPYGKSALKKELRNCIDCFKLVTIPVSQMMGDLPIERINPCRAFEKVGIDFAGPITTKCQHTRKANNFKSYICLFIFMCTKSVHLKLASSVSAAAFLSALRRFVSRRGYPSDIYSDNGTNFVCASAYMKDLFQLLHNSNVQDYSSSKNIK
ncbi:integrase catalytic domain-containing protein [Trichonephila clavipes]|nr:integrase catalytic domain-containing protein [Trichonephila clavipes]